MIVKQTAIIEGTNYEIHSNGTLVNIKTGNTIKWSKDTNGYMRAGLWTGADGVEKCFNTFEGWQIETGNLGSTTTNIPIQRQMGNIETAFQEEAIRMMAEDDDDLPF